MKFLFVLLLACVCGCSGWYDFDRSIAGHPLPSHFVRDACDAYADELNLALFRADIDSIKVSYIWRFSGQRGNHAIVIFSQHGKLWGMDNVRSKPKQIFGRTDFELVLSFDANAVCMSDLDTYLSISPREIFFK